MFFPRRRKRQIKQDYKQIAAFCGREMGKISQPRE